MDNERFDPNARVVCPYDPLHIISVKRYQHHIIKCRKNHQDKDYVGCPFNAKHMLLRHELKTHLAHCADRVVLESDVRLDQCPETGEVLRLKGNTDLPEPRYIIPDDTEDWDNEIEENLAEKLEQQKITTRRLYNENRCGLRKPCIDEVPFLPKQTSTDHDDTASVCSTSSGRSSIYVMPVRHSSGHQLNNTAATRSDKSNYQATNNNSILNPRSHVSNSRTTDSSSAFTTTNYDSEVQIDNNLSYSRGRGRGVLSYAQNKNKEISLVKPSKEMQGVHLEHSVKKTFGRGTIRGTLLNYQNGVD